MQSQVPNSNKYTIGKYLRNKKRLYKPDETATFKEPSDTLKEYMTYLTEKGMTVHKMSFADFKLKNGLSYSGVVASEKVFTNETILKIPKDLILNTRKAFFSELKPIFLENAKFFSAYFTSAWEDRILLVYLVNEYSKGPISEWYHMIKNLPREIDYVIFWDEEELELLEDPSLYKTAKQHRKIYDEEEAFVLDLAKKYPNLLNQDVFTPENVRWIYIHLVTRCFGKFLEYTTMVPIAEFLNHECVDVLYDLEYSINNPNTPANYSMPDAKELSKEELEGYDTSDGSNKSEDEEFDSDFEYEQDETITPEETKNQIAKKLSGLDLDDEIRIINDRIENMLVSDFDWGDGFSIFYVRGICKETAKVVERYKSKETQLEAARNLMQSLETDLKIFKASAQLFYEKTMRIGETELVPKQKLSFIKMIEEAEEKQSEIMYASQPAEELFDKEDEWREDTFDNFIMKASKKDQFDVGSQLFFCYGRLSNRCALLRYGISLEYNKYEHVHLKVPYLQYINDTAWLMDKIKSFRVSRYMRFKLRRTTMNMNLINFCKGLFFELDYGNCETLIRPNSLDLEIQGIHKAVEILEEFLQLFSSSPEENKDLLLDPEVGYHEYFATVYRLERQRVVTFHLRALQVLEEIVKRFRKGLSLEFAVMRVHDLETNEECNRNRIFFAKYLEILKEHWKDRDLKKPKSKKKNS